MFPYKMNHIYTVGNHGAWVIIAFSVIVFLLTSCDVTPTLLSYQDPQTGITFEVPSNWRVERFERYLLYVLTPKRNMFLQDSVRIEIDPMAISNDPTLHTLEEGLESEIDRLNTHFFKLDEPNKTQPIRIVANGEYQMATATIAIPTTSVPDDSLMNQMGQKDPSVLQIIDIYIIENGSDVYTAVEVYKGRNDQLNTQADEIVKSIRFDEAK